MNSPFYTLRKIRFGIRSCFVVFVLIAVLAGDFPFKMRFVRWNREVDPDSSLITHETVWIPYYVRIEHHRGFTSQSRSWLSFYGRFYLLEESVTLYN